MRFRFEIQVPAVANAEQSWDKPASSGYEEWDGTAHALGRRLLHHWLETAEDTYEGLPAIVEVWGEEPESIWGAHAIIRDPSPVTPAIKSLEEAIEAKQVADFAADRLGDELADAMRDVQKFDGRSANSI